MTRKTGLNKSFDQDLPLEDISASSKTLQTDTKKKNKASRINETTDAYKAIKKADDGHDFHPEFQEGAPDNDRGLLAETRKKKLKDKTESLQKSFENYSKWRLLKKYNF